MEAWRPADPTDLRAEIGEVLRAGMEAPLLEHRFQELALRVFRHQYATNGVYRALCRRRGLDPDGVGSWEEVPPVPTRAFKELALVSGDPREAERVFRTSGTTGGRGHRGEHHVLDLTLYHEALLPNFRAHLLPDGERIPFVSLVPPGHEAPDSSLSHMVEVAARHLAAPGGGWFVDARGRVLHEDLSRTLDALQEDERPVLVLATAFALVHWFDALEREGRRHRLPAGSRVMETGGFKGRSREVGREELYAAIQERLAVPPERVVNEYGMTELLSQFYEPVLRAPGAPRRHVPPPWVRTRVLDPATLRPVPEGRTGILAHFDLANLHSVAHVLTEDRGVMEGDGFRVLGRASGAEPRGCSLAMDELMAARRDV